MDKQGVKMFLTIGILVSDKDVNNLNNLISQIKEKVKIENEIIICNNSSNEIAVENATILNNGNGNIYQLRGRKLIIEQAEGDYIWFIDADDSINEVKEEDFTADIIEFNCNAIKEDETKTLTMFEETETVEVETNLVSEKYQVGIQSLWNKFVKTTILKQAVEQIPDTDVSALEDWIFLYASMMIAQSYQKNTQNIYNYNVVDSSSNTEDFSDCFEKFERSISGVKDGMNLLMSVTDNQIEKYFDCSIEEFNARFYLRKIKTTKDNDVCLKMLDLIRENFSDDVINNVSWWILEEFDNEEDFERFANIIQSRIKMRHKINYNGVECIVSPDWSDYSKVTDNLYQDKDIEGNPFTLNVNSGEIEIFTKAEDTHSWQSSSKKWRFHDNSVKDDTVTIHLSFGNACNLNCSYCYSDKTSPHTICLEDQKNVIDKILELYSTKLNYIVLGNTGEPLFDSKEFWCVYDYLIEQGVPSEKIFFNTNGVDFSEYDIKRIIEKGGINVSIDGPKEIQDAHRGEGTYDSIIEDVKAMLEAGTNICATCVFMDDEMPIFDILEHLYNIGFTCQIFYGPARIDGYWTSERISRMLVRYEEFYKTLEYRVCTKKEVHWLSVFDVKMFKILNADWFRMCPKHAPDFLDFDENGNIYSCYDEVGDTTKIIGNLFTDDMDTLYKKRAEELKELNYITNTCITDKCPFINFCGGKNNMCEHTDKELLCGIEKIKCKYLLRIYAYIHNHYLPEEQEFLFEDSAHRAELINENPSLLKVDPIFAKWWYYAENSQKHLRNAPKDDFKEYIE